jgi:ribosomal protein L35
MGKGQGATQGVRGDGEVKEPLMTKAHGNEGRDERSARQIADRGNEFVHAPSAKKYNPYE